MKKKTPKNQNPSFIHMRKSSKAWFKERADTRKVNSPQETHNHWRWTALPIEDTSRLSINFLCVFCFSNKTENFPKKFLLRCNTLNNAEPKLFKKGKNGKWSLPFTIDRCLPETGREPQFQQMSCLSWHDRQESNNFSRLFSWYPKFLLSVFSCQWLLT